MITLDEDRRCHQRVTLHRPCKIFEPRAERYLLGETVDLSAGGMLLRVGRPLELRVGDILHVGIAQKRRQTLLRTREMTRVRVVRCMITPRDETLLGLELLDQTLTDQHELRRAA